jgi:DNA-binding MarR family transcriptional regulator
VERGSDPSHRSVVNLALTPAGQNLVSPVEHWRQAELARIIGRLTPRDRTLITTTLHQLTDAAGQGYGLALDPSVPM